MENDNIVKEDIVISNNSLHDGTNDNYRNNIKVNASKLHSNSNSKFKEKVYWDERFLNEEKYDWLLEFKHISNKLLPLLHINHKILIVGCGNSTFSYDLYQSGYHNIVNIDYSHVVISNMNTRYKDICPHMKWIEMDMTQLAFPDHMFDIVIDKAAMDALVVDEGDVWNPHLSAIQCVDRMCKEMKRVLKPNNHSIFIQISFAQPHFRSKYLMGYHISNTVMNHYESYKGISAIYNWDLYYETINKDEGSLDSFLYIMNI